LSREATVATVKQKIVSTTAQTSKSAVGEITKNTYQNKFTDAVKQLFGF
jgi:hypothetical protein